MKAQRLDQFIAHATGLSRKEAKLVIKQGRVCVNSTLCKNTAVKITKADSVSLNKQILAAFTHKYYALNKPSNYCCSHNDDGYPSAIRLMPNSPQKLLFSGRLDADTTGLIFISTDGQWCHRVSHAAASQTKSFGKVYQVDLAEPFTEEDRVHLCQGVLLKNETKATRPCDIRIIDVRTVHIELFEGKYHQVKRMFAATGNKVMALKRLSIHGIELGKLALGEYRELSNDEVNTFSLPATIVKNSHD